MPKKIEDIVSTGKRSIRDIPVPIRRVEPRANDAQVRETISAPVHEPSPQSIRMNDGYTPTYKHQSSSKKTWIGIVVVLLGLALAGYSLLSGATLSYKPKVITLAFANDTYSAAQSAQSGQLSYSVMKLSVDKSIDVPATGDETVSEGAKGRVIIYNKQSAPQQLIKTTRLETPDGKLFRLDSDITVPAKGSIEVGATADVPGADGNIALSDFTLPGLKGLPRYELVYGRSKTTMSGGFVGTRKKVSAEDLAKAKSDLETTVKSALLSEAKTQSPTDSILFPDLSEITYELLPTENASETTARVTLRGNLAGAIFKQSDLAKYLAVQKLGETNATSKVEITNFSTLNVSMSSSTASLLSASSIKFSIAGTAILRGVVDEKALAAGLAGKQKSEVPGILKNYPSIESAQTRLRPFWKSAFPNDASKIKIERKL